jgi:hypothetical protein
MNQPVAEPVLHIGVAKRLIENAKYELACAVVGSGAHQNIAASAAEIKDRLEQAHEDLTILYLQADKEF